MLDRSSDVSRIVDSLVEKGLALLSDMLVCDRKADKLLAKLNDGEVGELNRLLDKIRS